MQFTPSQLQDRPFVVKEKIDHDTEFHGMGRGLSMDGMTLETPAEMLGQNRFLWLEFGLGTSDERVKALAEVIERGPFGVKVRFKHLFPDHKRKLAIFLDEEAFRPADAAVH